MRAYEPEMICVPAGQTATIVPLLTHDEAPSTRITSLWAVDFQIPDWHRGKRANPVSGVYLVPKMVFTRISELLKVFIAGIIQLESSLKSMSGEATPPPEKSTLVTLITVQIRFH